MKNILFVENNHLIKFSDIFNQYKDNSIQSTYFFESLYWIIEENEPIKLVIFGDNLDVDIDVLLDDILEFDHIAYTSEERERFIELYNIYKPSAFKEIIATYSKKLNKEVPKFAIYTTGDFYEYYGEGKLDEYLISQDCPIFYKSNGAIDYMSYIKKLEEYIEEIIK